MKAVLFDLDDTLFPELEFVRSGFRAAARVLAARTGAAEDRIADKMWQVLEIQGRGAVFDTVARDFGVDAHVKHDLVYAYRTHAPTIRLFEEAKSAIARARGDGFKLALVTDGMASVQRRKIEALAIAPLFDFIVCTDELGRDHWKPSTVPFQIALASMGARADRSAYIGNDIAKDFIGPNALGMGTVHVVRDGSPDTTIHYASNSSDSRQAAKLIARNLEEAVTKAMQTTGATT